jgi:hypothetical protein
MENTMDERRFHKNTDIRVHCKDHNKQHAHAVVDGRQRDPKAGMG